MTLAPAPTLDAPHGMVCAPDHLASSAGRSALAAHGSAADAAIAASAVLAVTFQQGCGLGGDIWAVAHPGGDAPVVALDASGRAGSGADLARLRAAGHRVIPASGHVAAVPVPGCVDGWMALHERLGRLPLAEVLAPAIGYAEEGFPASVGLVGALPQVASSPAAADYLQAGPLRVGARVRRPGVGRALRAIAEHGRAGFYQGEAGAELIALGGGEYTEADLAEPLARWVQPLSLEAFGARLWSAPPTSQGYLTLAGAWIADGLALPGDPDDPLWAHLLIEAARQAAFDRSAVLYDGADGAALINPDRLAPRRDAIDPGHACILGDSYGGGGTVAVVAAGIDGDAVSMLHSNAAGFGSGLALGSLRIFLHNRGVGFSAEPGHPAAYGPRRRPPHTLSPAMATHPDGRLRATLATMGGDSQPQVLLQLLARILRRGEDPAPALCAGRFALASRAATPGRPHGFDTWSAPGATTVRLEGHAPPAWDRGLSRRGHHVERAEPFSPAFGHAQAIVLADDHLRGWSDPRSPSGGVAGW